MSGPGVRPGAGGARGLVDRIGGRARLRSILERFYARLAADPMVGFFFAGHDLAGIIEGQQAFLLWATGAEPELTVRHPRVAHGALPPILRGHFDRRLRMLSELLEEEGLAPADRDAWLRIERSMRRGIQAGADRSGPSGSSPRAERGDGPADREG